MNKIPLIIFVTNFRPTVATAVVKLTEYYLQVGHQVEVVMDISSFHSAFDLFRWVWLHRKEAREHRTFFQLALRMTSHLNQSLAKPHNDELTRSVLKYLAETIEILSHDAHGLKLADKHHMDITATVEGMSPELQLKFKVELEELKKKLNILGAGKNKPKSAGKPWNKLLCQLHFQPGTQTLLLHC